jgi:streptogramin lyase
MHKGIPLRDSCGWKAIGLAILVFGVPAMVTAQSGTYSQIGSYPVSDAYLIDSITAGPDGALWFTNYSDAIGRITTAGAITQFPVSGSPYMITPGPDGALWFTGVCCSIGRITTTGVATEYGVPGGPSLYGIAYGPDGALWFAQNGAIGRITTAGSITQYPVPWPNSTPFGITAGPDGAMWFTDIGANYIGRITTSGAITGQPTPTPGSIPEGITTGLDGNLWFAESSGNKIGRVTTAWEFTEYPLPSPGVLPIAIVAAPDGALWFTEENAGIARITTAGLITQFPVPANVYGTWWMAVGSDGALWLTAFYNTVIARAPVCALGFSAGFAEGTLTMNFDLGIDTPATFSIHLRNANGPIGDPFSENIPAVAPPHAFTMSWSSFPDLGEVTVQPTLAAQPGGQSGLGLCSEWTTVNTAP